MFDRYDLSERCTPGMQKVLGQFDELLRAMKTARSPRAVVIQVFGQLFSLVNGHCCNALMLRRSLVEKVFALFVVFMYFPT